MANRFYAVFCCLIYWLNAIEPENTLVQDFKSLLQEFPNVDTTAMALPQIGKKTHFGYSIYPKDIHILKTAEFLSKSLAVFFIIYWKQYTTSNHLELKFVISLINFHTL